MPLRIRFFHKETPTTAEARISGTNPNRTSASHGMPETSTLKDTSAISGHQKLSDEALEAKRAEIERRVIVFLPNPVPILANEIALLGPGLSEFLAGETANDNGGT